MKKRILPLLFFTLISSVLFATHNQAGEIIFKQIDALTFEASIITYTKASGLAADRDSLFICWGDNICDRIARVNGPNNNGEFLGLDTKMNIYTKTHTYAGIATYLVSVTDPNRNAGILNVDFPNSETVPFYLDTELMIFNSISTGPNNSPILLQPPIDVGFTGIPYMHSPNAFDMDGDSIAYELIDPMGVSNYVHVTDIEAGSNNNLTLNEETGLLIWDAPQVEGLYTIVYLIKSYRDGQQIGRMVRDMQIEVEEGPGAPPEIIMANVSGNDEVILADLGDTVRLDVTINAANPNQTLEVSATSGLFDFSANSTADFNVLLNGSTATATFEWIVKAEHLREQPYQLVIKAADGNPTHPKNKFAIIRYKTSTSTTSIPELELAALKVFPNPVQEGYLNLYLKQQDFSPKAYVIFNALGQTMLKGKILSESTVLNVKALSQGTYYLLLEDGENRVSTSFVVQ